MQHAGLAIIKRRLK